MNSVKNVCRIGQMSIRSIRPMSTKKWPTAAQLEAEREPNIPKDLHPNFYKLKADQKLYQKDDNLPVHLKRGARDKVLLYFTIGLVVVGTGMCMEMVSVLLQK